MWPGHCVGHSSIRRRRYRPRDESWNDGVDGLEILPERTQEIEPQRVRAVRKSALRSFVNLDEDAVHSGSHCSSRQRADELRLAPGDVPLPAGKLDAMGGIEHHGPTGLAHDREAAHVDNEVVVAERR